MQIQGNKLKSIVEIKGSISLINCRVYQQEQVFAISQLCSPNTERGSRSIGILNLWMSRVTAVRLQNTNHGQWYLTICNYGGTPHHKLHKPTKPPPAFPPPRDTIMITSFTSQAKRIDPQGGRGKLWASPAAQRLENAERASKVHWRVRGWDSGSVRGYLVVGPPDTTAAYPDIYVHERVSATFPIISSIWGNPWGKWPPVLIMWSRVSFEGLSSCLSDREQDSWGCYLAASRYLIPYPLILRWN